MPQETIDRGHVALRNAQRMIAFQIGSLEDRLEYWRCRAIDFREDIQCLQAEVERIESVLPPDVGYGSGRTAVALSRTNVTESIK